MGMTEDSRCSGGRNTPQRLNSIRVNGWGRCVAAICLAFLISSTAMGAVAAYPAIPEPGSGLEETVARMNEVKLLRDREVAVAQASVVEVSDQAPLPREAYLVQAPLPDAVREALCALGEARLTGKAVDHAVLWRTLAVFVADAPHDRTRDLAIRSLKLPVPKEIGSDQLLTIRAALVVLIQNGSEPASHALYECALFAVNGSASGFFPTVEGQTLPAGFPEKMARRVCSLAASIAPKETIVAFTQSVLDTYQASGRYGDDSRLLSSLRRGAETAHEIEQGVTRLRHAPPLELPVPEPDDLLPAEYIQWANACTHPPRLSSGLLAGLLPNLTDPEGYASMQGDNPASEPDHLVVPKEAIDLLTVARDAGRPQQEALQACEDLARDARLPECLRMYAELRALLLLSQMGEQDELMRRGEQWLGENPNAEIGLAVRWHLAGRLLDRPTEEIGLEWDDRQAVLDRLIAPVSQTRSPYDRGTLSSYYFYAQAIETLGAHTAHERRRAAVKQAQEEQWPLEKWQGKREELIQFELAYHGRAREILQETVAILEQFVANPNLADRAYLAREEASEALSNARRQLEATDSHVQAREATLAQGQESAERTVEATVDKVLDEAVAP